MADAGRHDDGASMGAAGRAPGSMEGALEALAAVTGWLHEGSSRLGTLAGELAVGASPHDPEARTIALELATHLDALRELLDARVPDLQLVASARASGPRRETTPPPPEPGPVDIARSVAAILGFLAWSDQTLSYDEHGLMKRIVAHLFDGPEHAAARDAACALLNDPRVNGDLPLDDLAVVRRGLDSEMRTMLCALSRRMLETNGGITEIEELRLQAIEAMLAAAHS